MKHYILTVYFVLAVAACHAQADYDSLKEQILRMDIAINNIHHNMRESHNEFKLGTAMVITGIAITGMAAYLNSDDKLDQPQIIYVGVVLTGIGGLIQIDSHHWLGRGAWKKKDLYE